MAAFRSKVILSLFSSTFYTPKRHNTLQEWWEEAGEAEEV
jgi:hypothetical protein